MHQGKKITYTTQAFAIAFAALAAAHSNGNQKSLVDGALDVSAPDLSVAQQNTLAGDMSRAASVFTAAFTNNNQTGALGPLNTIFLTKFFG
jgi:hypothetical protein